MPSEKITSTPDERIIRNTFIPINRAMAPSLPEGFFDRIPSPDNTATPSVLYFSLHKAASTLLRILAGDLANQNRMTHVDIQGFLFRQGLDLNARQVKELAGLFLPRGYSYGVFRCFEQFSQYERQDFLNSRKSVLLVRDPRDALTSMYFSHLYSHVLPGGAKRKRWERLRDSREQVDLDGFVLEKSADYLRRMLDYGSCLAGNPNCRLYRYEDVIFRKADWIVSLADHLGLGITREQLGELLEKVDLRPQKEDIHSNVRQVTPGDHRKKLKSSTIDELNQTLEPALEAFGYQP